MLLMSGVWWLHKTGLMWIPWMFVRVIGLVKAAFKVGMMNLVCNPRRFVSLHREVCPHNGEYREVGSIVDKTAPNFSKNINL